MGTRNLSVLEKKLLLEFISDLSERFSNAGCNDYSLPNDASHRLLMDRIIQYSYAEGPDREQAVEWIKDSKKTISTMDFLVLDYLKACIEKLPTQLDADAGPLS